MRTRSHHQFWVVAASVLVLTLMGQPTDHVIPYQGQLASQTGQPLNPATPVTVVFRLYQAPVGGTVLWEEAQPNVSVHAGRFSVLLGSRAALPNYTNFNATLYLGITLDDGDPGTADVEMRPRQALVPVISANYSREAANALKLNGFDWSALFGTNAPTGAIHGSRIESGSITSNQIAPHSIDGNDLAPATVGTTQIATHAITRIQLGDGQIDMTALAKQVAEALCPPGSIMPFGGSSVPDGWLLCDGRTFNRTQYPRLWTAIGTGWGGSRDQGVFNLPDLRGLFLRGVNAGRTDEYSDPEPTSASRGAIFAEGNVGDSVGSYQRDAFQGHGHQFSAWAYGTAPPRANDDWMIWENVPGVSPRSGGDLVRSPISDGVNGVPNISRETRPKNASVNYIIKY